MDADELLAKQLKQMEKEKKEKGSKLKTQEKKVTGKTLPFLKRVVVLVLWIALCVDQCVSMYSL